MQQPINYVRKLTAPYSLGAIELVERDAWLLGKVCGLRVLHAGATDSMLTDTRAAQEVLLHQKLRAAGCDLVGVDIDAAGIDYLRDRYGITDIVGGDLEELDTLFHRNTFDIVLAADVMEHLNNPGRFLASAKKVLKKDGQLIITVPNAFSMKKFLGVSIFRQERNHPDHVCFYSYMNLHELLRRFGFAIVEAKTFMLVDSHRPINRVANVVTRAAMALTRNNYIADELAVVAVPFDL